MEGLKVAVVGAGPVGSLTALYAATRGAMVSVYELRSGKLNMPPFPFCCWSVTLVIVAPAHWAPGLLLLASLSGTASTITDLKAGSTWSAYLPPLPQHRVCLCQMKSSIIQRAAQRPSYSTTLSTWLRNSYLLGGFSVFAFSPRQSLSTINAHAERLDIEANTFLCRSSP